MYFPSELVHNEMQISLYEFIHFDYNRYTIRASIPINSVILHLDNF